MNRLERFVLALTRNRTEAEDVISESILIIFQSFENINSKDALLSYAFTIASRVWMKRKKELVKQNKYLTEYVTELFDDKITQETADDVEFLYNAMEQITPEQKETLILTQIMGFSIKETAEIQQCGISAVKMRIQRGKESLKKIINKVLV